MVSSKPPTGGTAPVEDNTTPQQHTRISIPPEVSASEGAEVIRTTPVETPPVCALPAALLRIGGHLQAFQEAWAALTSDAWVLQTVRGFHIEFYDFPQQLNPPHPIVFSEADAQHEVPDLLRKGAICCSALHPFGFLSNLFLVDKPNGGRRPVINLKELNG